MRSAVTSGGVPACRPLVGDLASRGAAGAPARRCQVALGLIPALPLRRRADLVTVIGGAVVRRVAGSPDGQAALRRGDELPITQILPSSMPDARIPA
jgi:hypothetical protein